MVNRVAMIPLLAMLFGTAAAVCSPARAAFLSGSGHCTASVGNHPGGVCGGSAHYELSGGGQSQLFVTDDTRAEDSDVPFAGGNAASNFAARAVYGHIGISTAGGVFANGYDEHTVPSSGTASGESTAEAFDFLTVMPNLSPQQGTAAALPLSIVHLNYFLNVQGQAVATTFPGGSAAVGATLGYQIGGVRDVVTLGAGGGEDHSYVFSGVVEVMLGQPFVADMFMSGFGRAEASSLKNESGSAEFSVLFLHTADLFLTPVEPGITLVAESGHDYGLLAIPEPPVLALTLVGLIGVFRRRDMSCRYISGSGSALS